MCVSPHAGPHNNNSDTANMAATAEPLSGERQGGTRPKPGGSPGWAAPLGRRVPWNEGGGKWGAEPPPIPTNLVRACSPPFMGLYLVLAGGDGVAASCPYWGGGGGGVPLSSFPV